MIVQVLGRNPDCDLVLDSPMVSRRHAELSREGETFLLRDLESANGTFLDGVRIQEALLTSGQEVYVGPCRLVFDGRLLRETEEGRRIGVDAVDVVWTPPGSERAILDRVSLSVRPGEFVALVGASGAGKSTLLSCLLGLRRPTAGRVLYNGLDSSLATDLFRSLLGYVPQDDIVHRDLEVEEALHFSARMRLPADTDQREIQRRVDFVLATMGLGHRRQNRIGTLSGGERKRVSVGVELLTEPGVLFMDEPTSGLDPGMEKKTMQLLARLARGGRTVILITHATQNILLCDQVAFLAPGGRLAFFGPPRQALEFFGVEDFADIYLALDTAEAGVRWRERFQATARSQEPERPTAHSRPVGNPGSGPGVSLLASCRQLGVLLERYARLLRADRQNLTLLLGQAPIIGVILALLFEPDLFGLRQEFSGRGLFPIQDGQTLLFLLMMSCLMFGVINSCREVVKELPIFRRERLVNLQLVPYLLSKVLLLGLLGLLQSAILLATILLRIPLALDGPGLLQAFLFLFAACLGGVLLGLIMSSLTASAEQSMSLVSVVLILQLVFSGAFIRAENMPQPLNTLSLLAVSRWCFGGLASLARLNERLQELGLPFAGVDFAISPGSIFGILLPVLALHFVLAAVALRWREARS